MFKGSCVALVTPFKNGKIDEEKIKELVNFHIQNSTNALLPCGTTGESATLTPEEHLRVVEIVVQETKKRIPVIAGSGTNSTEKTIHMTKKVKEIGADAALIVCPYYNKPTQKGLYQHYKKIAEETNFPIIIYNIPSRTGVNMLPETIIAVAKECPNIIGIKEASGSLDQVSEIIRNSDKNFHVWSGDDSLTLPMLAVGGEGIISVIANIFPKDTAEMCNSFFEGNVEKAKTLHLKMFPLIKMLFVETNPIPVKAAMEILGLCSSEVRLPLTEMDEKNREKLEKALRNYLAS